MNGPKEPDGTVASREPTIYYPMLQDCQRTNASPYARYAAIHGKPNTGANHTIRANCKKTPAQKEREMPDIRYKTIP